jgi:hypothetical protein
MKRINNAAIATVAAAMALAACNDSGFVPLSDALATAAGVYSGKLTADPAGATDLKAIVLDDGSFWTLYGQAGLTSFTIQGFARGTGDSAEGVFTSSAGTDFGFAPPVVTSLEANYNAAAGTFAGSYTTVSGTTTFAGGPMTNSTYDFGAAPSLPILVGAWDVQDTEGTLYTLDVAADGTFALAEQGGGCTGSGAFTPNADGRNVFDVSVDFANVAQCVDQAGSASGITLVYTITGAAKDQLLLAVNDGETFGMALFGTRASP